MAAKRKAPAKKSGTTKSKAVAKKKTRAGSAAKAPVAKKRRAAPPRLTVEQKQTMLKPGDDLNELVTDILTAWDRVPRQVRVADVSPARLRALLVKATRASARESTLIARQAERLAPLSDARIVAHDAIYRAALKVKRVADAVGASDVSVAEAFATVTERFRRIPAPKDEPPAA